MRIFLAQIDKRIAGIQHNSVIKTLPNIKTHLLSNKFAFYVRKEGISTFFFTKWSIFFIKIPANEYTDRKKLQKFNTTQ